MTLKTIGMLKKTLPGHQNKMSSFVFLRKQFIVDGLSCCTGMTKRGLLNWFPHVIIVASIRSCCGVSYLQRSFGLQTVTGNVTEIITGDARP